MTCDADYKQGFAASGMGFWDKLHSSNFALSMSQKGQFLPKSDVRVVSPYRPIADVRRSAANGRNGPGAELSFPFHTALGALS